MSRCLFSIFLLLLVACGDSGKAGSTLPDGSCYWKISLGPRVAGALAGRPVQMRAWGPWWSPLWSRKITVKAGERDCSFITPLPGANLQWISLGTDKQIFCSAYVSDGVQDSSFHLEIRELEVKRSAVVGSGNAGFALAIATSSLPTGFLGGGVAMDRGSRAAIWAVFSDDLDLQSNWLMPWQGPGERLAFVRVESLIDTDQWGDPEEHWDLAGEEVRRLAFELPPHARIFTAGFTQAPIANLPKSAWPKGKQSVSFWSPGWESKNNPQGEFLIGHADWKRFVLLVPAAQRLLVIPLWRDHTVSSMGKEDPPLLLWSMAWSRGREKRLSVDLIPLTAASLPHSHWAGQDWSLLVINKSGGVGKGFQCGEYPLQMNTLGGAKVKAGKPLVILETPLFPGSKGGGLALWPPGNRASLKWGIASTTGLKHRGTCTLKPGTGGIDVR